MIDLNNLTPEQRQAAAILFGNGNKKETPIAPVKANGKGKAKADDDDDKAARLERKLKAKADDDDKAARNTDDDDDIRTKVKTLGKLAGDTVTIGKHRKYGYGVALGEVSKSNRSMFHRAEKWLVLIRFVEKYSDEILSYIEENE